MEKLDRAWMTPLLNRIADIAGEQAAMILGRERAGQQVYIPATLSNDHWLVALIGQEEAAALCAAIGPDKITLPPALSGDKRRRAMVIAELIDKGYSNNEITRMTGVARSTVNEHRKRRPKAKSSQLSLF